MSGSIHHNLNDGTNYVSNIRLHDRRRHRVFFRFGFGLNIALNLNFIQIQKLTIRRNHKFSAGFILIFIHKDWGLDGISDLKHFIKGIHQNNLIAVRFEKILDFLNIRFILRKYLLDTRGVGNVSRSRKINERSEEQYQQSVDNAKHDCCGFENFAAGASRAGDHLRFRIRN